MQIREIATAQKVGAKGHGKYEWCACPTCGRERWVIVLSKRNSHDQMCKSCGITKFNETRRAENSPVWKGGKRENNGYIWNYVPDDHEFACMRTGTRYVLEHRLVMARSLGRPLGRFEIVHHKDGVRHNNEISNLELTALGEHAKEHSKGYCAGFQQGYEDGLRMGKREGGRDE